MSFDSVEIRDYCEIQKNAVNSFGEDVAKKLRTRISEFSVALKFVDLPPHFMNPFDNNSYRVALANEFFLYFSCGHAECPREADGKINWNEVSRIKLLTITNQYA